MEAKIERKRKRNEAFEKQRSKEKDRVEAEAASKRPRLGETADDGDDERDDDDDDGDDGDDIDGDANYIPSEHGKRRTRNQHVTLTLNANNLRQKFSALADRRHLSSTTRSDIMSLLVTEGGGNLSDVPCSQRTMIK